MSDTKPVDAKTPAAEARRGLLGVYAPPEQVFVAGEGPWLIDEEGRRYLDFVSGIGVNALGHGAPEFAEALTAALEGGLVHTSNLFRTRPAERLAARMVDATFPGRVYFCNSGGESGEAALKVARKWAKGVGGPAKHEIVAFHGSFHGRLFGTLALTDRPAYREPFEPLMPGVRFADVGDLGSVEALLDPERTAAVILEPVQGESGIRPVPGDFLRSLRDLCDERQALLIFDEVQCGMGRTGRLFAHQWTDVRPDLLMVAKPLAGGLPMGALVVAEKVAGAMAVGDHGTTFGGGPLVSSVALRMLEVVSDPAFLEGVRERGELLGSALRALAARSPRVREVRGVGLMWGVELDGPAAPVVQKAREEGELLVAPAGKDVVRLLPPLNVDPRLIEEAVRRLESALA